VPEPLTLRGPDGRPLRVAHLTTVDMSLALLLGTELRVDVGAGLETYGLSAPGEYVDQVRQLGVRHVPLAALTRAWDPRRDGAAARELAGALRRLRLDVLHTHNPKTGVLGRLVGRILRVPVVVNTCHGLWAGPEDRLRKRALVYGVEGVAALASHAEFYQNASDYAVMRRVVRNGRGYVVGNGVDLGRFQPDRGGRLRVRAEFGVGSDELLVGGVGRRVAEKGIREFAAAARTLTGRARFMWVGPQDADKADAIEDDETGVQFVGRREDMAAVYSAFDVFVLPSYREGFSRSGMEAAACGLPMVLSDIRGCRELGHDGEHLMLVPPRNVAALTAAIETLLMDSARRAQLGAAARRRALAEFDQVRVAASSLRTYARVAERKGLGWVLGE
jgi:glycosyltransferase involved in cell wall biosynthesis